MGRNRAHLVREFFARGSLTAESIHSHGRPEIARPCRWNSRNGALSEDTKVSSVPDCPHKPLHLSLAIVNKPRLLSVECLLYPQKRTFGRVHKMSAKCQKRTSRSAQKVPHCPGHSSGVAERTLADLTLFVEPLELFLPLFAAD